MPVVRGTVVVPYLPSLYRVRLPRATSYGIEVSCTTVPHSTSTYGVRWRWLQPLGPADWWTIRAYFNAVDQSHPTTGVAPLLTYGNIKVKRSLSSLCVYVYVQFCLERQFPK